MTAPDESYDQPLAAVPIDALLDRLEALLPGLAAGARARRLAGLRRLAAMWARVHPDTPLPSSDLSPAAITLAVDHLLEHAAACGAALTRRQVGEGHEPGALASLVLGDLAGLDEPLLAAADALACRRAPARELLRRALAGDPAACALFHGDDAVFACTSSRRMVVHHHEGWIFDLRFP